MITKGERAELRSITRQQFKVLRDEIEQRRAELLAGVEDEIADRYSADDQEWSVAKHKAYEAVREANRVINDAYRDLIPREDRLEPQYIGARLPERPTKKRTEIRRRAEAHIDATVRAAILKLNRQEADLLRTLAVGALETDEARAFLNAIPTAGELVPAARLAELEASLGEAE